MPSATSPNSAAAKKPSRTARPFDERRLYWAILACLVTSAAVLRWHRLNDVSYIFDEAFCWKLISFGPHEIWRRAALDNHPPLYFYLLWCWSKLFGDSPEALRSMSVLCGVAAVIGGYLLARECGRGPAHDSLTEEQAVFSEHGGEAHPAPTNPRNPLAHAQREGGWAGLAAAALIALSPMQIDWSQHARMYSLGAALAVFSTWLLLRAVQATCGQWKTIVFYVATASALTYTHYFGLLIVAGHVVWIITAIARGGVGLPRPNTIGALALAFGLVALAFLPWLPQFLAHQSQVASGFYTAPLTWRQLGRACYQTIAISWREPLHNASALAAALFLGFALPAALLACRRAGPRLIGIVVLTTLLGAIAGSLAGRGIVSARYLIFAHLLLLCGVAAAIFSTRARPLGATMMGMLLLASGVACARHADGRDEAAGRPGMRQAMAYVGAVRRQGEPIIVANPMIQIMAAAYAPTAARVQVFSASREFPYFQGTAVMSDEEYISPEQLERISGRVVWVVDTQRSTTGTWEVTLPRGWVDVAEERFAELGNSESAVVVRRCLRRPSRPAKSRRSI